MQSLRFLGLALLTSLGCAAARPAAAPPAAPKTEVASPADPSPNRLRDRRAEPGVRAPAKALVLDKASSVKCGKLAKAPRDGEDLSDLLGGRLRVRAPVGAKAPAPLAGGPPLEEESRLVVDGGKVALAIVARETFQLDPDLYEVEGDGAGKPAALDVEAPKYLKATFPSDEPLEIAPVEIGPTKMRGYVARPPHPNAAPGKDTALVLALLLAQEDGALESVAFYVRGEMVRSATGSELVGCTRLAERIGSSLAAGPRKLERAAGRRHVADVSTDEELAMTVPPDYVAVKTMAGTRVTKLRPLSLYAGSINVSIGSGPKPAPEGADTTAAGRLLGRPIEWRGKASSRGGFFFAAEPLDPSDGSKTAEVLVKATRQAKALDEMRSVAETLAVVKRGH